MHACIVNAQELVEEGHVKYIGLSEISPADVRKAHAIHPITALEMEWSLFSRDAEVGSCLHFLFSADELSANL